MSQPQTATHSKTRPFWRVGGLLTIATGLVLTIVGIGSFLIYFFSPSAVALWPFLCSFMGWVLLFIGSIMWLFSKSSTRFKATEQIPIATVADGVNEAKTDRKLVKDHMQLPPLLLRTRPPDWMMRNWKWFVPVLCLVVLVCFGSFLALLVTLMKSSDAYSGAVARAESSPAVIAALGTPVKDGFLFSGNISENNSSGSANLVIPISGPKGSANLYVSAIRSLNKWHFDELIVEINKTKQRIDISDTNQLRVATPAS